MVVVAGVAGVVGVVVVVFDVDGVVDGTLGAVVVAGRVVGAGSILKMGGSDTAGRVGADAVGVCVIDGVLGVEGTLEVVGLVGCELVVGVLAWIGAWTRG